VGGLATRTIALNRIEVLSTSEYRETPVRTIRPHDAHIIQGVHTLNRSETLEVLDVQLRLSRIWRTGSRVDEIPLQITRMMQETSGLEPQHS
jgi:hypothetical protein